MPIFSILREEIKAAYASKVILCPINFPFSSSVTFFAHNYYYCASNFANFIFDDGDKRASKMQAVIDGKIKRRLEGRPRRVCNLEAISPAQNGAPGPSRFAFCFARKELPKCL
jgi:hypothetical protein